MVLMVAVVAAAEVPIHRLYVTAAVMVAAVPTNGNYGEVAVAGLAAVAAEVAVAAG